MAWMVGRVLLPEALRECPRRVVVLDTLVAFALMLALQLWLVP
jgi:type IV secretory pathway TrbD component